MATTGMPISIDDLPRATARPVQWKRLFENLKKLHDGDESEVLDAAFSVGDSIGGMSDERQLARFIRTPEGQDLWAQRVCLTDALADHGALAELPDGSLGRAFLDFCVRHGINSRALVEHQHAMSRDYAGLDPLRRWFNDRLVVMHDLWHVLAGYDATQAGESALMCFQVSHRFNDRALPIFIAMSIASGNITRRNAWEAIQCGRRAKMIVNAPLEELLSRPLSEARRRFDIEPPNQSHPVVTSNELLISACAAS